METQATELLEGDEGELYTEEKDIKLSGKDEHRRILMLETTEYKLHVSY